MTNEEKRKQVVDQCRVVKHLAASLAEIHGELAEFYQGSRNDGVLNQVGQRTARLMENLGDVLNGMDAVSEDDKWTHPIFEKAQELWPAPSDTPK